MGLFQRQQTPVTIPLYTLSNQTVKLIVGLGNPGKEYDLTRHNTGFNCLDAFAEDNDIGWRLQKNLKAHVAETRLGATRVILMKPTTFMNLSGEAVQAVQAYYKVTNQDTLVVHDEIDMPFGQLRVRRGGGSAGHNGIKSLIKLCGEDFARLRVGIRNDHAADHDMADFVLQKFSKDEQSQLKMLTKEVSSILTEYIFSGELQSETRSFIV